MTTIWTRPLSDDMNIIFFRSDCLYVATHSKAAAFVVMEDAVMFWKRGGRSLAEISFLKIAYYLYLGRFL